MDQKKIADIIKKFNNSETGFNFTITKPPSNVFYIQELFFFKVTYEDATTVSAVVKFILEETFQNQFHNEIFMYKQVLPLLSDQSKKLFPRILYASPVSSIKSDPDTAIALEDLTTQGFQMTPGKIYLEEGEIKVVLRAIGQFHAEFYTLKLSKPKIFDVVVKNIKNTFRFEDDDARCELFTTFANECLSRVLNWITKRNNKGITFMNQLKRYGLVKMIFKSIEIDEKSAVLCHGDFNRNNFLIRYENGVAKDCKIVDLQTPVYGSPARDLSLFLFMNIKNSEMRRKNWQLMWREYHDALIERLQYNLGKNFEVPSHLNLDSLQEDFKRHSFFGYITAVYFTYASFVENGFVQEKFDIFLTLKDKESKTNLIETLLEELETEEIIQIVDDLSLEYLEHSYDPAYFDL